MNFIPLKSLFELFKIEENNGNRDLIAKINQEKLNIRNYNDKAVSEENWNQLIRLLENPKSTLFYSWIDSNKNLKNFLETDEEIKQFTDSIQHLKHAFAEEYKSFLSPFVYPKIANKINLNYLRTFHIQISYIQLLTGEYKTILESKICSFILTELRAQLKITKEEPSEEKFINHIEIFCNDSIIESFNLLSKESYASKIEYIDELLKSIHFEGCTNRFANWLINQLMKLNLNDEHISKIQTISRDLKKGKIQPKNQFDSGKSKLLFTKKSILISSLIVCAFLFVLLIINFSSKNQSTIIETPETAYQQFSKEERKEIDSILKTIEKKEDQEIEKQDGVYGESAALFSQHEFKNEKMKSIYSDLLLDAELVNKGQIVPLKFYAKSLQKKIFYPGVSKINKSKKEQKIEFYNQSEYDILLFCIDNNNGGKINSKIIFPNETLKFEVYLYDEFLFIPGGNFGPFVAPRVPKNELPSLNFKHHFTKVDYNYINGIKQVYRINILKDKPLFINAIGNKNNIFEIEATEGLLKL